MTDTVKLDGASFRDPAGHVYLAGGRVLRSVTEFGAAEYEFVRESGLLPALIAENRVIGMSEVPKDTLGGAVDCRYVLEHPALDFVSYPYEWCFSALRAAALLQLDLLIDALDRDITLSDASAYNIQFRGTDPVFIDALSFRRYREGEYWTSHQQFCDQFLNPLLLTTLHGVAFNAWFRGNMEGIPSEDLNRLLSWRQKLSWRVLTHVTLPVRLQTSAREKADRHIDRVKTRSLPRSSFSHLIAGLRNWIAALTPPPEKQTAWGSYENDNSYDSVAAAAKAEFTRRFASTVKPAVLWDFGCNTGAYAEIALTAGAEYVVGFDTDVGAVETAFSRATANGLRFLPLVLDAANPSPGQGWQGQERKSLDTRGPADGLIAYAFLHHLCIGRNVRLPDAIAWLTGLAPQGVIEFVEKDDPMVRDMLRLRDDIFFDYSRDAFLAALEGHAEIVETAEIIKNRRMLVWYKRRDD